jgi:hypothetical protein
VFFISSIRAAERKFTQRQQTAGYSKQTTGSGQRQGLARKMRVPIFTIEIFNFYD